jgi:hypothetical protein
MVPARSIAGFPALFFCLSLLILSPALWLSGAARAGVFDAPEQPGTPLAPATGDAVADDLPPAPAISGLEAGLLPEDMAPLLLLPQRLSDIDVFGEIGIGAAGAATGVSVTETADPVVSTRP